MSERTNLSTGVPEMLYARPTAADGEFRLDLAARLASGAMTIGDVGSEVDRWTQPLVLRIERAMRAQDHRGTQRMHYELLEIRRWLLQPAIERHAWMPPGPIVIDGKTYEYVGPKPR